MPKIPARQLSGLERAIDPDLDRPQTSRVAPREIVTSIVFPGRVPPKKNSKRWVRARGRQFLLPSQSYQDWENSELPSFANAPKLYPPYRLEAKIYAPDFRNCDLTNLIESVNDLLVKTGMLEDDNWFGLTEVSLKFAEVDPLTPRVEVLIYSQARPDTIAQRKDRLKKRIKNKSRQNIKNNKEV